MDTQQPTGHRGGQPLLCLVKGIKTLRHSLTHSLALGLWLCLGSPNVFAAPPQITSKAPTEATVGELFSYQVIASDPDGTALHYTLDFLSGPLEGMSIDDSGLLTWAPSEHSQAGLKSVGINVIDEDNERATQYMSLRVADPNNQLPVAGQQPATEALVGETYIYDPQASDGDGDPLSYNLFSTPQNSAKQLSDDGVFTWPVTRDDVGSHWVLLTIYDGIGATKVQYPIKVTDPNNEAPVFDNEGSTTAFVGQLYQHTVAVSDADGDEITLSLAFGPDGMTLDPANRTLSWTPTAPYPYGKEVKLVASDNYGGSSTQIYFITVEPGDVPPNTAPVANSQTLSTNEDESLALVLGATDADGDALSYQITAQPTQGVLTGSAPNLSYTPNANSNGEDQFSFVANDGTANSNTATVTINVVPQNDVPVANAQSLATNEDSPLSLTLSGSDIDGDTLSYQITTQPINGILSGTAPNLSYTPNANSNGADQFSFVVNDGVVDSDPATINITVSAQNDAPVAESQTLNTDEDVALALTLNASDLDGDALSYQIVSQPSFGVLSGIAPNLSYAPSANSNGTDQFSFVANDGTANSNTATVIINVAAQNDVPVANAQSLTTNEDTPLALTLSGSDVDGDDLSYQVTAQPTQGTLSGSVPNLTYTPNLNVNGQDQLSFVVNDGTINSAETVITFTVNPVNDPPVFVSTPANSAEQGVSYTYLPVVEDPDNTTFTYQLLQSPEGMSLNEQSGELSWVPASNQVGEYSVSLQVSDGIASVEQNFMINVSASGVGPVITSSAPTVAPEGTLYQYDVEAEDSDSDTLSYSLVQAPPGMSIDPQTGLIEWQADEFVGNVLTDNSQCQIPATQTSEIPAAADIVLLIDISGSMEFEVAWISGTIARLDAELKAAGVGTGDIKNRYGYVKFGSDYEAVEFSQGLFGTIDEFVNASFDLIADNGLGGNEDALVPVQFIANEYPFRAGVAKQIIMMTDEDRFQDALEPTAEEVTQILVTQGIRLDGVTSVIESEDIDLEQIQCADGRFGFGLGPDSRGYVLEEGGAYSICDNADFVTSSGDTVEEQYVFPVHSSGGIMWDLDALKSRGDPAKSFTKALVDESVIAATQDIPGLLQSDLTLASLARTPEGVEGISATILNRGLATSQPAIATLYDASGQALSSLPLDAVQAGASVNLVFETTLAPDATAEAHYSVTISLVDGADDISECLNTNNQLASPQVIVRVTDESGASDQQAFLLNVSDVNNPPAIVSAPDIMPVNLGQTYTYQVTIEDQDIGDAPLFSLVSAPSVAKINPQSGLLKFTPGPSHVGTQNFTLKVRDLAGSEDTQSFTLEVVDDVLGNYQVPRFSDVNNIELGALDTLYTFTPTVTADATAELSFTLLSGPEGMTADVFTGVISWSVPSDGAPYVEPVAIAVVDQYGNQDILSFDVFRDIANAAPYFTGSPNLTYRKGYGNNIKDYRLDILMDDPNARETLKLFVETDYPGITLEIDEETLKKEELANGIPGKFTLDKAELVWDADGIIDAFTYPERRPDFDYICRVPGAPFSVPVMAATFRPLHYGNIRGIKAAPLYDTNNDGSINEQDTPVVLAQAAGTLYAVDGATQLELWRDSQYAISFHYGPAVADLDGDGDIEILLVEKSGRLIAVKADDRSLLWRSGHAASIFGPEEINVVDLDGDGLPEIMASTSVFDRSGNLLWSWPENKDDIYGPPSVVDFDMDGSWEVIYAGEVRDAQGNFLFNIDYPQLSERQWRASYSAVVNADEDDYPEIVLVDEVRLNSETINTVSLADNDGGLIWGPVILREGLGQPIVGDINGDGELDIYVPANDTLLEISTGELIWQSENNFASSRTAQSVGFDVNGDGIVELLSHRGFGVHIIDGQTGRWIKTTSVGGLTNIFVAPLVVDLDGNGDPEVVASTHQYGVTLYDVDITGRTVPSKASQRLYPQAFFNDDMTIKVEPELTWLTHNTSGIVAPTNKVFDQGLPDLRASSPLGYYEQSLSVEVSNRGSADYTAPFDVELYLGDPATGGVLIDSQTVDGLPFDSSITLDFGALPEGSVGEVVTHIATPSGLPECRDNNNTASSWPIKYTVEDHAGLSASTAYLLSARRLWGFNLPFVSNKRVMETETLTFNLSPTYNRDDNNTFYLDLHKGPRGISIDQSTGNVSWTPPRGAAGKYSVVFYGRNLTTGELQRTVSITVDPAPPNTPPEITSTPAFIASTGQTYTYNIVATDADGDTLTYGLSTGPEGMSVNATTGELTWLPTFADSGQVVNVALTVDDGQGAVITQSFSIAVDPSPPLIISTPPVTASSGELYTYTIIATDDNGDQITYGLKAGPEGMNVDDATGELSWLPNEAYSGQNVPIEVTANDGNGGEATQSFSIAVDFTPPQITSTPALEAIAEQPYTYTIVAVDDNGDTLTYGLKTGPQGMSVDANTGLLTWLPTLAYSGQIVSVEVTAADGQGGQAIQSFGIAVNANNDYTPVFSSTPSGSATVGESYQYLVEVSNLAADQVSFVLDQGPVGMSLNGNLLTWVPSANQQDAFHAVTIRAIGPGKAAASQSFAIKVGDAVGDQPFVILSSPSGLALVDQSYVYTVVVQGAAPSELNFSLTEAPAGMTLSPAGELTWLPSADDLGTHPVVLQVSDATRTAIQSFQLTVSQNAENSPPVLTSQPNQWASVGNDYLYLVQASDVDGDPLTYSLTQSPAGMSIATDGSVSWNPSAEQVGDHPVTVNVSDGFFNTFQTFPVRVTELPLALEPIIQLSPAIAEEGESVLIEIISQGSNGIPNIALTFDGNALEVDPYGRATITAPATGSYLIEATVSDERGEATVSEWLTVRDPNDTEAPEINIISPAWGDRISAPTEVVASINDSNLTEYQVYLAKAGSDQWQSIAQGTQNVESAVVATIDPTLMTNGQYDLIISALDVNGQQRFNNASITIEGALKVGNMSFSVTDLQVPLEGMPITVTRTYDSRRKHETNDLGYGWTFDYRNMYVEESMEPTQGWDLVSQYAVFIIEDTEVIVPATCYYGSGKTVTVTMPNGDIERFTPKVRPTGNNVQSKNDPDCYFVASLLVEMYFEPEQGTQGELSLAQPNGFHLLGTKNGYLGDDITATGPKELSLYRYESRAGIQYDLEEGVGIQKVTDTNGRTLTYSDDGIVHSNGKSVSFERDAAGRVEQIIDPANRAITYNYDSRGDLSSVTERDNTEVSYVYDNDHALVDILDPLNRRLVRNVYNDEGRLTGQLDQDNNLKTFDHDLDARTNLVADLDGRSTLFVYDDRGNVTTETMLIRDSSYEADILTSYTYDANDNQETKTIGDSTWTTLHNEKDEVTESRNPENEVVFYEDYNDFGQEGRIIDEREHAYTMHYDGAGNLTGVESPPVTDPDTGEVLQPSASTIINAQGQVESTTDLRGLTTTYTYYLIGPSVGQKHTESNSVSGTVTYTYDDNNNVKTETRERSVNGSVVEETTHYDYDQRDRLTVTTYHDDSYTETVYDLVGNVDRERDRFGNWADFDYDPYGRLILTTYPDSSTEARTYTDEGLLETITDRLGRVTRNEYDDAGRLWKVHNVSDSTYTETRYNAQGWVVAEYDELRQLTEYEYDKAGRRLKVIRHIDGGTQEHGFTYYPNGELHTETDANGHTTTYVLNELDQRIAVNYHNSTSMAERFDFMGTRTSSIDQEGRSTRFDHDLLGRLTDVTPEVSINNAPVPGTSYTYDEVGNRLTQTDANGHTTVWTYDLFGRVLTRTLPEMQSESFVYTDGQGCAPSAGIDCINADSPRTTVHTDFNGDTITMAYDVMGRLIATQYSKDGRTEVNTYYDNGQVHTVTDQHGITEYIYDNRDRLDTELRPDGSQLVYDYDDVGNRTGVTVTRNGEVSSSTSYTYDDLNRLETATDSQGTTVYSYDAVGNLDTVSYGNGLVTDYDYNSINQLTDVFTRDALSTLISHFHYDLSPSGRREIITELDGRTTAYCYDNLYRLRDEVIFENGTAPLTNSCLTDTTGADYVANYDYDWVGNRTYETVDGVQTAYQYDDNDRLESTGGTSYGYDDNGNTLTETLDGVVKTYTWDGKNKLSSVESGGVTTAFAYNHNGVRTSKTEGGFVTHYIVDENRDYAQVLEEVQNGQASVQYTYGHDLINQSRNGTFSFFHYDGLGSTRALSDEQGNLTNSYDYTAFGAIRNQTGSTENNYLFTGEQFDSALDQYYLRARYYDQNVGRFTQMDTWSGVNRQPITLNKYLYANVDPGNMVDPTGNFSIASTMTAVNVVANLAATAQTAYSLFQIASGEEEFSARDLALSILLSRVPGSSFAKNIAAKFRAKTGRTLKIPCFKNSFIAGTPVHTKRGLIPIEEVQIGDYVLSFNEVTGENEYQEVVHLIRHENDYELVNVEVENGEKFLSTLDHPFYVNAQWKDAADLMSSDSLTLINGTVPIVEVERLTQQSIVYNFTVANTHTYFIGEVGVLVHNDDDACVISVANMDEFFDTVFGASIKRISNRTGRQYDGAQIYKASRKSGNLKKNDYYYLDNQHKDHLEVFDSNGDFKAVLNLDGTINQDKTLKAAGRSIRRIIR